MQQAFEISVISNMLQCITSIKAQLSQNNTKKPPNNITAVLKHDFVSVFYILRFSKGATLANFHASLISFGSFTTRCAETFRGDTSCRWTWMKKLLWTKTLSLCITIKPQRRRRNQERWDLTCTYSRYDESFLTVHYLIWCSWNHGMDEACNHYELRFTSAHCNYPA